MSTTKSHEQGDLESDFFFNIFTQC